jgi:hypothetical protein
MSEEGVAYFYESVIRGRQLVCRNHAPQSVTEALPNRTYTLPSKATFSYSDLAVIGHVTAAEKGPAFAHAGEDVVVPVSFDDPSAAERTAHVHVTVEEFFGKEPVPAELVFQMGLLNADNPGLFLDGLRSLGRIAVALTVHQRKRVLIPAEQGALIARIDGADRLTFPALAPKGETFLAGVTNVAEFRTAAAEPPRTVVLKVPQGRH